MDHFEMVRTRSRYDTWAGKPFSRTSRFHHLVEAPELGAGFQFHEGTRPRPPRPALTFDAWDIYGGSPSRPLASVNVFEYPTLAATHDQFLQSLQSITRPGIDYTPLAGGPGDVCVAGKMVRDNLVLLARMEDSKDVPQRIPILRAIDAWLVSDWPLAASRRTASPASLDVVLRLEPERPGLGEPADLAIEVRRGGQLLDPERLPHRIVVTPGRIERSGAGYVFTPSAVGPATVSVSVLGPQGEHGAATLSADVQ